jgi:hypothetical protein
MPWKYACKKVFEDELTLASPHLDSTIPPRVPACRLYILFAEVGGLLSYGVEQTDNFRRAATYVDRTLKGEKPSELCIGRPTRSLQR